MSECRRIEELLTPYVDAELTPASARDVEQHVHECPACRGRVAAEQAAKAALRRHAAELAQQNLEPSGLRARCEGLADEQRQRGRQRFWGGRVAFPRLAAVGVLVGIILALPALTSRSDTVLAAQLAADHMKCFKVFADPSVTADAGDVERLLRDFGWQMRVPATSGTNDLRLLGGRWCLYSHGRIPHVLYEADGAQISLFRLDGRQPSASQMTVFGHHSLAWHRDGHTFVLLASDKAAPVLERIARYMEQEAR